MARKRQDKFDCWTELARTMSRSRVFGRVEPDVIERLARTTVRP